MSPFLLRRNRPMEQVLDYSRTPIRSRPYFHLWLTPALWAGAVGLLWMLNEGEKAYFGGYVGTVLSEWLGWPSKSGRPFIVRQLALGASVMMALGFAQDLVRLPRWTVALYPAVALTCLCAGGGAPSLGAFLFMVCMALYGVAPLSCLASVMRMTRRRS